MEIRKPNPKPKRKSSFKLVRGADGRLRQSSSESDIGDIWAEQRRIRLSEAIEGDKIRQARRHIRTERGFVGLVISETSKVLSRIKTELFGQSTPKEKKTPQPPLPLRPKQSKSIPPQPRIDSTKTVEIKLSMPGLTKLKNARHSATLRSLKKRVSRKNLIIASTVGILAIVGFYGYRIWDSHRLNAATPSSASYTEHHSAAIIRGTPTYGTILPAGKTIQDLGGWARVSPPDKNPVYAYTDKIDGIDVAVSEQPLPPNFQNNTTKQLAQLAQSVSASLKLIANNNTTIYLGTSPQGPQSVVLAKENLLILVKSDAPIPNDQWISYINSLQ